ncbi:MAG: glycosyltransferase family 39 protein [Gaiellaceae bacterium]
MSRIVALPTLAVAAFLAARLTAWPPHEDEMLALHVARGSLGELVDTVVEERGGAPLHFVLAWLVEQLGGGLTGLRALSAIFAVAAIPVVAAIARRLADERAAVIAAVVAASSWVLLFHAVYARMYSLFLLASALSYLALLRARTPWGWALWGAAILVTVATHPYGALVLASQGVYVLLTRERLRQAIPAFAAVAVLGIPFWIIDLVLAGRFDVGVGPGQAGIATYLWDAAADFSAGPIVVPAVLVLAGLGLWRLPRRSALLIGVVVAVPTLALLVAQLGSAAVPETRHLIFVLPFFATAVAAGVVSRPPRPAVALTVLLAAGGVTWAWDKTPSLFLGEPEERVAGRAAAAAWLADTGRANDLALGYDPVFLAAGGRPLVLPRADAGLQLRALERAPKPLGRGVWVFSVWGPASVEQRLAVAARLPRPVDAFEARTFGPYLLLRTREPTRTVERYLERSAAVMVVGKALGIADADLNFAIVARVYDSSSSTSSASTTSR